MVKFRAICILCHIACDVPLSICCKSCLRYVKSFKICEGPLACKKRAVYVQAVLDTIQFRMLHVLICKTDTVPAIVCGCEI